MKLEDINDVKFTSLDKNLLTKILGGQFDKDEPTYADINSATKIGNESGKDDGKDQIDGFND